MRPDPKLQLLLGFGFSISALLLLVLFLLKPDLFHPAALHHTRFRDVTGLRVGAEVTYAGFSVGRVVAIEPHFDQGYFDVGLRLRGDWVRPEGIAAQIDESNPFRPAGILLLSGHDCPAGGATEPGAIPGCGRRKNVIDVANDVVDKTAGIIETFNRIVAGFGTGGEGPGLVDAQTILDKGQKIVDNLDALTASLKTLASPERMAAVTGIIDDLEAMTAALRKLASEQRMAKVAQAVDDLSAALASTRQAMHNVNEIDHKLINKTMASLEQTSSEVAALVATNRPTVTDSLTDAKFILQTTSASLPQILLNLEEASRNFSELAARLRDDPSALLRGRSFRQPGEGRAGN